MKSFFMEHFYFVPFLVFGIAYMVYSFVPRSCSDWAEGNPLGKTYKGEEYQLRYENCRAERAAEEQKAEKEQTP